MKTIIPLIAVFGLVACQQEAETESEAVVSNGIPATASKLAECAKADADGKVVIGDGLNATVLSKGYGNVALLGDRVTVNAKLWVHDPAAEGGKGEFVWDSGTDGFAFEIGASGFIDGWSPGVACMLVGEKRELIIASQLAYKERGRGNIPGNADIIYELELVKVERPGE